MVYDTASFSFGVELEYGDSRFNSILPSGAAWNMKDNTCVSTTGIANDPLGKLYEYGGEINTKPTWNIEEQVNHIAEINQILHPQPVVNYRSNLHIHVQVPGLKDDLDSCKKLLTYVHEYQQQAFDIVETIPVPNKKMLEPEVYKWAVIRMKRRYKSHQHKLPSSRVQAMLAAKTTKEFYEEHAALTERGRMWFFSPRAGINLRQMWEETSTIEFRHFPGTLDMNEMESCIRWCRDFLNAALNTDETPVDLYNNNEYNFPNFQPYEYETEQVYQWTNFDGNSRKDVENRLNALRQEINIDAIGSITSKDVYPVMCKIKDRL